MNETTKSKDYRIEGGIVRGKQIEITVDGKPVRAFEGETIAAALTAAGIRKLRHASQNKDPRGLYCCMGTCHGCLVTVDGQPNMRSCITPAQPGQNIKLQDGLGHVDLDSPLPDPGNLVREQARIIVIGGGPAGLSAAIAAAESGAQTLVIDENLQAGGQIYRQPPETYQVENPGSLGEDYADGQALLRKVECLSDKITIWNDALVWSVFDSKQLAIARGNDLVLVDADAMVVATGAYERPVPVAGWTLPGVMTAGGAQLMLKSQRVRPGQKVLLAGTGPLQLVVASQMLDAGMDVVAVAESASIRGAWRYFPDMLRQPRLIASGLKYVQRLKSAGVKMMRSYVLKSIEGETHAHRVILEKVDSMCRPGTGETKSFDTDTVCIGYGLIPSVWLTSMLGCRHHYDPLTGGWIPGFDAGMQTDQAGVFVAGDGAGIAGVLVARAEGRIAGLSAAVHAGILSSEQAQRAAHGLRTKLNSLRKFRRSLDQIYRIYPDLYANITDDTIVCRCEGITAGEIREAMRAGTFSLNDIKKRSRAGMGHCQAANCAPVIAAMLVRELGLRPEAVRMMTTRPPARPIPLNLLSVDKEF
jgi:NADPH-dependent 2,4-dienoyl-CoA reductase/sulfur reductase-like enzyme